MGERKAQDWEEDSATLPSMGSSAKERLRDNIRLLLERGETTWEELLESGAVTNGTLGRIVEDDGQNVRLSVLDALAYALKVEPWQLLHPDFEIANLAGPALKIARKMETIREDHQERVYAKFVQDVDFANVPLKPEDPPAAASAPGKMRPRRLRRVK